MLLVTALAIGLISGYAVGEAIHAPDSQVVDGLKIVPGPGMIDVLRAMKSVFSYVPEDEKFDGEGVEVKHEGRMFVVEKAEDIEGAVDLLRKYPAPTEETIQAMRSEGNEAEKGRGNFVVYFLGRSDYKTDIRDSKTASTFVSTDLSLASELGIPAPGIYGYNGGDGLSYNSELSGERAKKIVSLASLPMFGFTSMENVSMYRSLSATIFYIFFEPKSSLDILKEYPGTLDDFRYDARVILIPNIDDTLGIEDYELTRKDLPGCVSIRSDGGKYVLRSVTKDAIAGFVRDVLEKRAEIFYKSQEEPKDNATRGVKVITRSNSKLYIDDADKDRLIVFGTERCPHCIRIKPVLEKLGEIARANADDKLVVGYCDVDMNDMSDFEIRFVPTILLFKAGGKESVQHSGGERTLPNLVSFIRESGGLHTDLSGFVPSGPQERRFEAGDDVRPEL